jgi:hypothetical protein
MATLQEQYNSIKSGNGNKDQFLKQARSLFPQYFNQYTDFNTATNVLKSKQIISEIAGGVVSKGFDIYNWKKILAEEVKAEEKETSKEVKDKQTHAYDNLDMKNADNVNFNEIMKGFYAEMRDEKNAGKTGDELKAMVVKNLAKDPLFYTKDGMFGVKGLGYTTEAPGLGQPKEPKGKYKASGYGDLDTEIKIKEPKSNVKDSLGVQEAETSMPKKVKEMPDKGVTGVEKKIKLQENKEEQLNENEAIYDQMADLEYDLMMADTDEQKAEIEAKLRALESGLQEAMYQGVTIGKVGGGGGRRFIPTFTKLSQDAVDAINAVGKKRMDWNKNHILINNTEKGTIIRISQLLLDTLAGSQRGNYKGSTFQSRMGTGISPAELNQLSPEFKKLIKVLNSQGKLSKTGDYYLIDVPIEYDNRRNEYKLPLPDDIREELEESVSDKDIQIKYADVAKILNVPESQVQAALAKSSIPGMPFQEQKIRSLIRSIIKEELNENDSQIKKGDTLYHKNSGATLEVTNVDGNTISMKVTKVKEDGPAYIKVGQLSKTTPAAIGKTYTKSSVNEMPIKPDVFKRATDISRERGDDQRTMKLGQLFFNKFRGKPLMDGTIEDVSYTKPQQGEYEEVIIKIEVPSSVVPGETKTRYIYYDVNADQWGIDKEITRADARLLSLIAQHINPETKYKSGGVGFKIKGY